MLLNLSNHPNHLWGDNQRAKAIELYGEVKDLPFPQISPSLDSVGLDLLVEDYEHQVRKFDPIAVHIMGEMTFTFRLVTLLKSQGILCIASTTQRIASEENGIKISKFEFVQFRSY
jgi:hypothetical protein